MAKQQPTMAAWRKARKERQEGIPQTLISGVEVRMRSVSPDKLLRGGSLPDVLTPLVVRSLYEDVREELDAFTFTQREDAAEALRMIDSVNVVCQEALVWPRIVDDPQNEDEISIDDLSLSDRMWIFRLAFMPAEVLSSFRYQQEGDVEGAADKQGDRNKAKRAAVHQ